MNVHKSTILAIVLSLLVVIGWQYFVSYPQVERHREAAEFTQQERMQPGSAQLTTAGRKIPLPTAATEQSAALTREAAIAASPHVAIDTPLLRGSIDLEGCRIDDLLLERCHETVNPNSVLRATRSNSRLQRPPALQLGLHHPFNYVKGLTPLNLKIPPTLPTAETTAPDSKWEKFAADWPEPIAPPSLAESEWRALTGRQREHAMQAAIGYGAYMKAQKAAAAYFTRTYLSLREPPVRARWSEYAARRQVPTLVFEADDSAQ
jgi:hypothetical protein